MGLIAIEDSDYLRVTKCGQRESLGLYANLPTFICLSFHFLIILFCLIILFWQATYKILQQPPVKRGLFFFLKSTLMASEEHWNHRTKT